MVEHSSNELCSTFKFTHPLTMSVRLELDLSFLAPGRILTGKSSPPTAQVTSDSEIDCS
jgi:hypothetical protein